MAPATVGIGSQASSGLRQPRTATNLQRIRGHMYLGMAASDPMASRARPSIRRVTIGHATRLARRQAPAPIGR